MNKRQKKKNRKRWETGTAKQRRHNKWLCKRYPFLIPRIVWTDEVAWDKRYAYTLVDDFPRGWWKAFGLMLCEELREELIRCNYLRQFRLEQVKEKFGELRIYFNGIPVGCHVDDIIGKYSVLSRNICIACGKPDTWVIDEGWIMPECYECYEAGTKYFHMNRYMTEEEIRQKYEKAKCGDTSIMSNVHKYRRYSADGWRDVEIDISDTANKIRARWEDGLY